MGEEFFTACWVISVHEKCVKFLYIANLYGILGCMVLLFMRPRMHEKFAI